MKKSVKIIVSSVVLLGLFPFSVGAQSLDFFGTGEIFFLSINPEIPRSGDNVVALVSSSSFNVGVSEIRWSLDGRVLSSGTGKKSFSFVAGLSGETMNLRVDIVTQDGRSLSQEKAITIGEVDILWESGTYTPPFYSGKNLHSYQTDIKAVAIPRLGPAVLSFQPRQDIDYQWSINGKFISGLSGFGKNTATVRVSPFASSGTRIGVRLRNLSGETLAENGIIVLERFPKIIFYEDEPLLGERFESALSGSLSLEKEEVTIKIEPYYVTMSDLKSGKINIEWRENGKLFDEASGSRLVTFGKTSGRSSISVSLRNLSRILQTAFGSLTIQSE